MCVTLLSNHVMYLPVDQRALPNTVHNYIKLNNQVMEQIISLWLILCVRVIMKITLYYHISNLIYVRML